MMKKLIILITLFTSVTTFAITEIKLGIPKDVHNDYLLFLNGKDVSSIKDYSGKHSRRDVVETIIVHKIFHKLKKKYKLTLKPDISYQRLIKNIEDGSLDGSVTTIWDTDINKDLLKSHALISDGQFHVGIFGKAGKQYKIKEELDFFKFTIVSNPQWTNDWKSIRELKFKSIQKAYSWDSIVNMIKHDRADITLAPLPKTKDFSIKHLGVTLHPIKGYKFKIKGSRHLIFGNKKFYSSQFFNDFQLELKKLIKTGQINKAYIESGFMSPILKSWKAIN